MHNEQNQNIESGAEGLKGYIENPGKVIESGERFSHVMALALNSRSNYKDGVIRCILSREGDVEVSGYIDRSALYKVSETSNGHFAIGEKLELKNQDKILSEFKKGEGYDFLGCEDPDIFIDEKGVTHLYFTMPFSYPFVDEKWGTSTKLAIYLGHAQGSDLNSLEMTEPVLAPDENGDGGKEVSIAPLNSKGERLNLVESSAQGEEWGFSTVRMAKAKDMGEPWEYGETLFHPAEENIPWAGGHASPGPLMSKSFINVGEGKALGFLNGREANQKVGDKVKYGMFSVGLFIYDYENGKIDWVSPTPFIKDSEAKTITFASQFVVGENGKGVLYAHVDDSFVRSYNIDAESLKSFLLNNNVKI